MSFDRYRAQLLCENLLGCASFEEFLNADFDSFVLDTPNAYQYSNVLKEDASDLFYKGMLSLKEGLTGFLQRNYSWAVVKLYYSTFYMIRADLAIRDYGLIRHRSVYYLEANSGSMPLTKGKKGANRKRYSGDHKSTINYYEDLFSNSDILLSQNLEGLSSYEWLMKKRERINYQERTFNEPTCSDFLNYIDIEIKSGRFNELLNEIINDNYVKTFQPEYAALAIPIKRAILTKKTFTDNSIEPNIDAAKSAHLNSYNIKEVF